MSAVYAASVTQNPVEAPVAAQGPAAAAAPAPKPAVDHDVLRLAAEAVTPEMVARLASLLVQLGTLGDELARGAEAWAVPALRAVEAAAGQAAARPGVPTWRELLALARQPSTRRGLWFLLATAGELGRRLGSDGEPSSVAAEGPQAPGATRSTPAASARRPA